MRSYAEASSAVVTALNGLLGYDEAAAIAKQAKAERRPVRDVVVERGHVARGTVSEAAAGRGARRARDDPEPLSTSERRRRRDVA